jgi:hypothetical protein
MKIVIAIAIILIVGLGGWQVYEHWVTVSQQEEAALKPPVIIPTQLPGMDYTLEGPLGTASQRGASGLRDFLRQNGGKIQDPRLASIELDYVVLVSREDIAEARRVFAKVKARVPTSSPIYPRVKQLEKTYD